ncbi:MAG: hypothetical protein JWR72_2999 [Flavisolibacter sp.]|jgi:hypothetical protein|nr:hypothetical protein [Flavisolibacter sp.]
MNGKTSSNDEQRLNSYYNAKPQTLSLCRAV